MQEAPELTAIQREVLRHFLSVVRETGAPPTIGKLAQHFKKTPKGVEGHLKALAKKGCLLHFPGQTPAYRPSTEHVGSEVPILGEAPAGHPSDQPELHQGTLHVPWRVSDDAFAVKVVGESMQDAHVLHGDLVVVDPGQEPHDGNVVLAEVDGEQTIKRLRLYPDRFELEPANVRYKTIVPADGDRVRGRIVALLRHVAA
jgi:repressor LexA